jgi:hypothetical protein
MGFGCWVASPALTLAVAQDVPYCYSNPAFQRQEGRTYCQQEGDASHGWGVEMVPESSSAHSVVVAARQRHDSQKCRVYPLPRDDDDASCAVRVGQGVHFQAPVKHQETACVHPMLHLDAAAASWQIDGLNVGCADECVVQHDECLHVHHAQNAPQACQRHLQAMLKGLEARKASSHLPDEEQWVWWLQGTL